MLRIAFQAAVLGVVVAFGMWLAGNVRANSRTTGIPLTFDFLDQPAGFPLAGTSFRQTQSVRDAIIVGFGNTVRIAFAGIVAATVLGTLIGIARLSTNWLLSTMARVYVELVRNVPPLILIVFAYLAVFLRAPRPDDARSLDGVFVFSVRGVVVPWVRAHGRGWTAIALFAVAGVAGWAVARWRTRLSDRTGRPTRAGIVGAATVVAVAGAGLVLLGGPLDVTGPHLDGRAVTGGITMAPEYAALFSALVVYTSSHIAEIVRGSIQAVPRGQTEAATALALSSGQRMRLVILPQAMRIAVPALGNQYLNLTKNSSLAVAVSYFELTKVTQLAVSNRSPTVPAYGLLLFVYLALSLALSAVVNVVNRRLAVVER